MDAQLKNAMVTFARDDNRLVGVGFYIGDRQILTATHVLADQLNEEPTYSVPIGTQVLLNFPFLDGVTDVSATVIASLPREAINSCGKGDISLLLINDQKFGYLHEAKQIISPSLARLSNGVGHIKEGEIVSYGIRAGSLSSDLRRGIGQVGDVVGSARNIELITHSKWAITPGFSGGPIYSERLKAVVGLVTSAHESGTEIEAASFNRIFDLKWPISRSIISDDAFIGREIKSVKFIILSSKTKDISDLASSIRTDNGENTKAYIRNNIDNISKNYDGNFRKLWKPFGHHTIEEIVNQSISHVNQSALLTELGITIEAIYRTDQFFMLSKSEREQFLTQESKVPSIIIIDKVAWQLDAEIRNALREVARNSDSTKREMGYGIFGIMMLSPHDYYNHYLNRAFLRVMKNMNEDIDHLANITGEPRFEFGLGNEMSTQRWLTSMLPWLIIPGKSGSASFMTQYGSRTKQFTNPAQ